MKIRLVFDDWQDRNGKSIYNTDVGFDLSGGDLHSGTTFDGEIECDEDTALDLKHAFIKGFYPVFYLADAESTG